MHLWLEVAQEVVGPVSAAGAAPAPARETEGGRLVIERFPYVPVHVYSGGQTWVTAMRFLLERIPRHDVATICDDVRPDGLSLLRNQPFSIPFHQDLAGFPTLEPIHRLGAEVAQRLASGMPEIPDNAELLCWLHPVVDSRYSFMLSWRETGGHASFRPDRIPDARALDAVPA